MSTPATFDTFTLERILPAPASAVFAAFSDPARKRLWFADNSAHHQLVEYTLDFQIGGQEYACFRFGDNTPFPGHTFATEARHLDIVPDRRIVMASVMSMAGRPFSATLLTVELEPAGSETKLRLTHQGAFFEGADGPERRRAGWEVLLAALTAQF